MLKNKVYSAEFKLNVNSNLVSKTTVFCYKVQPACIAIQPSSSFLAWTYCISHILQVALVLSFFQHMSVNVFTKIFPVKSEPSPS